MTQTKLVRCNLTTGAILQYYDVPTADLADYLASNPAIVQGDGDEKTHYVLNRVVVPRPACPAVLTGSDFTALPTPCVIRINGTDHPATVAAVKLSLGPGVYDITVSAFPYLDGKFTLRV